MPKSGISGGERRKPGPVARTRPPDALEGQIEEMCRDLAVQVKRMTQLQRQAEELRAALREWLPAARS